MGRGGGCEDRLARGEGMRTGWTEGEGVRMGWAGEGSSPTFMPSPHLLVSSSHIPSFEGSLCMWLGFLKLKIKQKFW